LSSGAEGDPEREIQANPMNAIGSRPVFGGPVNTPFTGPLTVSWPLSQSGVHGASLRYADEPDQWSMIYAIEHAGDVLALFSPERPEWGATSVARALGVSKSGAHNLLVSLASIGLLRRVRDGQYRLGWRPLQMADTIGSTDELIATATPVMRELARVCGHPVALGAGANGLIIALTDERGTHVGGSSWFPRSALREALGRGPVPRPVIVRDAEVCHVAVEIEHDRPALRLAIGTVLPLVRVDRAAWVASAAAKVGRRLRIRGCWHDESTASVLV
jgi:hypothetical protein